MPHNNRPSRFNARLFVAGRHALLLFGAVLFLLTAEKVLLAQSSATPPPARSDGSPVGKINKGESSIDAGGDSLALPPRGAKPTSQSPVGEDTSQSRQGTSIGSTLITVISSLAIVLGLLLLCVWLLRRGMPKGSSRLPQEVVEILGQAPLTARQNVHLLRLGAKLLLVNVSPAGVETLCEIDDAQEVDRLAGLCKQSTTESTSTVFRNVFQQFSREPSQRGFLGQSLRSNSEIAAGKPSGRTLSRENLDG